MSSSWGRTLLPEDWDTLAVATLPKAARPGHSCGCQPFVCLDSTSPGTVCAGAGQHRRTAQGWVMPLAIFGMAGVRFSHVGRAALLSPRRARVRALAWGYSAAPISPFQLCLFTERGGSCLHPLPACTPSLPAWRGAANAA